MNLDELIHRIKEFENAGHKKAIMFLNTDTMCDLSKMINDKNMLPVRVIRHYFPAGRPVVWGGERCMQMTT